MQQITNSIVIKFLFTNHSLKQKIMAYTEKTTTGYGTRVKNSFKAIGTGFVLFLGGTALLWWNEGRAVKTDDMLNEAEAVTDPCI